MQISTKNDLFQMLLAAKTNREARNRYNIIFVEGRSPIEAAIRSGLQIHSVYYKQGLKIDSFISKNNASKGKIYELSADLYSEASNMDEPNAPIVLFKKEPAKELQVIRKGNPLFLLLDRPSNPGNLGTLIRSAAAFDVSKVLIVGHSCDHFDPSTISASRGAVFDIPIISNLSIADVEQFRDEYFSIKRKLQIIATDSKSNSSVKDFSKTAPTLLMLGNERLGLSKKLLDLSTNYVSIPTLSSRASLNIACAGSILMYLIQTS